MVPIFGKPQIPDLSPYKSAIALEDALLAAYKKMPGSSRHATVEIDDQVVVLEK